MGNSASTTQPRARRSQSVDPIPQMMQYEDPPPSYDVAVQAAPLTIPEKSALGDLSLPSTKTAVEKSIDLPPILRLPAKILVRVAVLLRQLDLDAIMIHEADYQRCLYLQSSHLRNWHDIKDGLISDAHENLRDFRSVSKVFAQIGAQAAIAVSESVLQMPKVWSHELPWEVDFCPWSQLIIDGSKARASHLMAVARNDILRKAVKNIKVLVGGENDTKVGADVMPVPEGKGFRQFSNLYSITARNALNHFESPRPTSLHEVSIDRPFFERLYTLLSHVNNAGCKITALRITDIDGKSVVLDANDQVPSALLQVLGNLTSLELCFWQSHAPHYQDAWPSGERKVWKSIMGLAVNLERLAIWNVPNNKHFTSTVYSHWGRFDDDMQILKALKTRKLRSLELVDVGGSGVLLADVICRQKSTLEDLKLSLIRLDPKKEAWPPFLERLSQETKLKECIIEQGSFVGPRTWEKYDDWYLIRDIADAYGILDPTGHRVTLDIGAYLLSNMLEAEADAQSIEKDF